MTPTETDIDLLKSRFEDLVVAEDQSWVEVLSYKLDTALWSKHTTRLRVLVPPGYPVTPPDNFFVEPDVRLADGGAPANTSPVTHGGEPWLQFSFHLEGGTWRPEAGHNLTTFMEGVAQRLSEGD